MPPEERLVLVDIRVLPKDIPFTGPDNGGTVYDDTRDRYLGIEAGCSGAVIDGIARVRAMGSCVAYVGKNQ